MRLVLRNPPWWLLGLAFGISFFVVGLMIGSSLAEAAAVGSQALS